MNTNDSGSGSLRQAILDASSGDTINFDPGLGSQITLTSGELQINKDLDIEGPGANKLTVNGNHTSRVFDIPTAGVTVTISGLTISGGKAANGGGILNSGTVTVTNSTLSGNSASTGGGIFNFNSGTVTLTNSTLSGNSASAGTSSGLGGGILNSSTLTVTNSTPSGNSASAGTSSGLGGGILNSSTLTVTNSTQGQTIDPTKKETDRTIAIGVSALGGAITALGSVLSVGLLSFLVIGVASVQGGVITGLGVLDVIDRAPTLAEVQQGVIEKKPFTGLVQIDHIPTVGIDPDDPSPGRAIAYNQATVPFNHALDSLGNVIRDARLINMAAQRYYGALNIDNLSAANFQRNNVFDFVHQFNSDRDAFHDELKRHIISAQWGWSSQWRLRHRQRCDRAP